MLLDGVISPPKGKQYIYNMFLLASQCSGSYIFEKYILIISIAFTPGNLPKIPTFTPSNYACNYDVTLQIYFTLSKDFGT